MPVFVRTIQKRQGLHIGSPDEISFIKGWINAKQLLDNLKFLRQQIMVNI